MLACLHNVSILIIEASLVHLSVVDVEAGAYLSDCSLVARFYSIGG